MMESYSACVPQEDSSTSGMLFEKGSNVVDGRMDHYPARLWRIVFCDFGTVNRRHDYDFLFNQEQKELCAKDPRFNDL